MRKAQEKVDLTVEVDVKTAKTLNYIARFHGCTVEELVENYIKSKLDKLPDPPDDFEQ